MFESCKYVFTDRFGRSMSAKTDKVHQPAKTDCKTELN